MKKTIYLDPPLSGQEITKENHDYLLVNLEGPQHIIEWFMNLPDIKDRLASSENDEHPGWEEPWWFKENNTEWNPPRPVRHHGCELCGRLMCRGECCK